MKRLIIIQSQRPLIVSLKEGKKHVLGRDKRADIRVLNPKISRQHLEISIADDKLKVMDLKSRNGFQVNGSTYHEAYLEHNNSFAIGKIIFIYQDKEDEIPDIRPIAKKTSSKKEIFVMALIVGTLILLSVTLVIWDDAQENVPINETASSIPPSIRSYLKACEEAVDTFDSYFSDPSRHFSALSRSLDLIQTPLKFKEFHQIKTALELASIFSTFNEIGHEFDKFTDTQLARLIASCHALEASRKITAKIKDFSYRLKPWAENQLSAHNSLAEIQASSHSSSLTTLTEAWKKIIHMDEDHVYIKQQKNIKEALHTRIGLTYLSEGKKFLDNQMETEGRQLLKKAGEFGQENKASEILNAHEKKITDARFIQNAQLFYLEDHFVKSENLLKNISPSSDSYSQAAELQKKINQRKFLVSAREAFTKGNVTALNQIFERHKDSSDIKTKRLIQKIKLTLASYQDASQELSKENYESAIKLFQETIDSLPEFDQKNFYKNDSLKKISELNDDAIAQKHFQKGVVSLNKIPPHYFNARRDFAVAEKYMPLIAENEIKEIVEHVRDQLTWYFSINESGDKRAIQKEIDNLKTCLTWLEPPQNEEDDSNEARLYRAIANVLEKH